MLRVCILLGAVLLLVLVIGSNILSSGAVAQSSDPTSVVTAYESARNRRDIDAALAYFADDATISQRSTTYVGKDQIRRFLESVSTRTRFVVVSDAHANGNVVSWTERASGGGPNGTVQQPIPAQGQGLTNFVVSVDAVVQDGKIKALAYNRFGESSRLDLIADDRPQLPAVVGLGAVLAVLVGVVGVASSGLGQPPAVASSLQGRLMQDLQGWSAARQ